MVNDCLSGRKSSIFCAFAQASATKKAEPTRRGRAAPRIRFAPKRYLISSNSTSKISVE